MKARDYMTLYNLIQNVDEDKKDPLKRLKALVNSRRRKEPIEQ
jgi:hypothetical protein